MDAVVAFLNSEIDSDIYIKLPPDWYANTENIIPVKNHEWVAKLLKALYRLKQSPQL
jgi:hypothetical protein